ncbi:MAG: carboxylating nicotinate-nucleotide diphosphorylase [Victivallaceae bacterium]|nr:carboxylating nicotinate-nucleotide diphosphorylase [Victivallaceae bacterium]NLK82823.1 carboxylating nicotinate-nucleotide diphosphorylase [Lentisphaerota bacterium]
MNTTDIPEIKFDRVDVLINLALDEDLENVGDPTTNSVIPKDTVADAIFICKEDCVCAGLPVAERVFKILDPGLRWEALVEEGQFCPAGTAMARVSGKARSLLTGERTALNFLQRLCGIATTARRYSQAVGGTKCRILDTRKTTPGWRNLEKYAVVTGGGTNHRIGLYDRIMIKDNHLELAGLEGKNAIALAVKRARRQYPNLEIEVEADTLEEVKAACDCGVEYVLLDNMDDATIAEAVNINQGRCKLEASGGITIERLPRLAALGVDFISVGALTHSVKSSDISLDISVNQEGCK